MSCPHNETTAILAAFGEAPDGFDSHLLGCDECTEVVKQHTETLAVLDGAIQPVTTKRARRWPTWTAGALLAAAGLLAISTMNTEADPRHGTIDSPVTVAPQVHLDTTLPFQSSLDSDLSELEFDLALLDLE